MNKMTKFRKSGSRAGTGRKTTLGRNEHETVKPQTEDPTSRKSKRGGGAWPRQSGLGLGASQAGEPPPAPRLREPGLRTPGRASPRSGRKRASRVPKQQPAQGRTRAPARGFLKAGGGAAPRRPPRSPEAKDTWRHNRVSFRAPGPSPARRPRRHTSARPELCAPALEPDALVPGRRPQSPRAAPRPSPGPAPGRQRMRAAPNVSGHLCVPARTCSGTSP